MHQQRRAYAAAGARAPHNAHAPPPCPLLHPQVHSAWHTNSQLSPVSSCACQLDRGARQRLKGRYRQRVVASAAGSWVACWAAATVSSKASSAPLLGAFVFTPTTLPALLTSIGVLIVSIAAAAFFICAIPTLFAWARFALAATALAQQVEKELPETAALIRLSGLELTDCVNEVSNLGSELTRGVRSTAQLMTMTEQGARQAVAVASQQLVPAMAAGEAQARGAVESTLLERAALNYTEPVLSQVATGLSQGVRNMRVGVQLARVAGTAIKLGRAVRDRAAEIRATAVVPPRATTRSPSREPSVAARRGTPETARGPSPVSSASLNGKPPPQTASTRATPSSEQ